MDNFIILQFICNNTKIRDINYNYTNDYNCTSLNLTTSKFNIKYDKIRKDTNNLNFVSLPVSLFCIDFSLATENNYINIAYLEDKNVHIHLFIKGICNLDEHKKYDIWIDVDHESSIKISNEIINNINENKYISEDFLIKKVNFFQK